MKIKTLVSLIGLLGLLGGISHAAPLGTAFPYQGRLSSGTNAANGSFDLKFSLWDALTDGGQVGSSLTNAATSVTNGHFTVTLDFGSPMTTVGNDSVLIGAPSDDVSAADAGAAYLLNDEGDLLAIFVDPDPGANDYSGLALSAAPPTLVSTVPTNMATGVSPSAPVIFTFSEAMNPMATTATFVDVSSYPFSYLTTSPAWSGGNRVLTCTPLSPWPGNHMVMWSVAGASATGAPLSAANGVFTAVAANTGCDTNAPMPSFTVSQSALYTQSSAGPPAANSNAPYCFLACLTLACPCVATNVAFQLPSGTARNMSLSPIPGHLTLLDCGYTNAATIEAAYPDGDYRFSVQSATCSQSVTVNYPANLTWPPAPHLTNFVQGQSINPARPFTLGWDPFTNGTATDCISVEIYGGVFQTPALGSPGALNGTARSVVFPAGTFQTNQTYSGIVSFYRYFLVTNPGPSLSLVYRSRGTEFTLNTSGVSPETTNIILPSPIHLETFEGAPEGALPVGWRAQNFTDPDTLGLDLDDPQSDSYRNWIVISRNRVAAIEQAGNWDAPNRLLVKPGQFVNEVEVTRLINGQFAYAESDRRAGNQVQYLFSPDYNLSGKRHIYLSYHSIYEQNQNSIGTVEYSIDGGATWLPVVYLLDDSDIARGAGGEPDGLATFMAPQADGARYFNPATAQEEGGYYGAFLGVSPGLWPTLGPYLSARVDDDAVESKRVEIFRLPQADDQPMVRLRFAQAGVGSWYFGIDDVGFYSIPPVPLPAITSMPQSQTVAPGSTLTLTVAATGENLTYEWRFNGVTLPGQSGPTLALPNVNTANAGDYQVIVSNAGGETVSAVATVSVSGGTISPDPDPMPTGPDNPDFEFGLAGWSATGTAIEYQPTLGDNLTVKRVPQLKQTIEARVGGDYWRNVTYPVGHHGHYWIGTAEKHRDNTTAPGTTIGEGATGALLSRRFQIANRYLSFLVGGHEDLTSLRVELLVETATNAPGAFPLAGRWYAVAAVATGHGEEWLRREVWNVTPLLGGRGLIRVLDYSPVGHINVDDFRFQDTDPYTMPVRVGFRQVPPVMPRGTHFVDWNAPVWGLADLHTHPMSYLGFGGKLMHGQPDGPIADALGDCNPDHGGFGVDNPEGNYYRELITKVMEEGNGPHREGYHDESLKQFRNWPVFSSLTHQQMWHEWIRRAYDGGLRVMVALCVNNQLLARVSKGDPPFDDRTVGDNQIQAMKDFAGRHSDFLEIAYDPIQLRDIVRRNKLAIILGSELDDIGNFGRDRIVNPFPSNESERLVSEALVRAEIQRLYDSGIRYIFPVHLTDNPFGGTAVGSEMLNIANKYVNGRPFGLEPAPGGHADSITFEMPDLDLVNMAVEAVAEAEWGPMLADFADPIRLVLGHEAISGGAGLGVASAILPIALIAVGNPVLFQVIGEDLLPGELWPTRANFPLPPPTTTGHRNTNGLTPLGEFAVREMMRRGMMIDVDHMSEHMITNVFALAERVPGRYPLNSGHNSARALGQERNENHRKASDYATLHRLGGLVGIGIENSDVYDFSLSGTPQTFSSSHIANDCAGTSKTVGQNYLHAFEHMQGRGLALGTDAGGFILGPGPRFGPQSAFGIAAHNVPNRDDQVRAQPTNGVLYAPRIGRALTTGAFVGPAVDPERDTDLPARREAGYEYNQDQRDFFAAIRIFQHDPMATEDMLKQIESALSDNYPNKRRIKEYAFGLVKGVTGADPGWDFASPDTGTREKLGIAVCQFKSSGTVRSDVWNDLQSDTTKWFRFNQHCAVWDDYHKAFGTNTPMKRCETLSKQWDINFEGMAHYGLIPDFLQDLSNVGLNAQDMSPLFRSAEDFAQMWTQCHVGAAAFERPTLEVALLPGGPPMLTFQWFGDGQEVVETTQNLGDPNSWVPFGGNIAEEAGYKRVTITAGQNGSPRFFRVRKD